MFVNNNIWTAAGLANGAVGTIVHMHWAEGRLPPALPDAVFVRMENYGGPQYFGETSVVLGGVDVDLTNVVPIPPFEAVDDRPPPTRRSHREAAEPGSRTPARCTRTQLPLSLAFAITIHKSQGQSLGRAVVDIGSTEQTDGQTITALSRVRTIDGLLLEDVDLDRLLRIGNSASFDLRLCAIDHIRALDDRTRSARGL